jgi:GTP cyclohydrolase IV
MPHNSFDFHGSSTTLGRSVPASNLDSFQAVSASAMTDRTAFLDHITDVPASTPTLAIPVAEAGIGEHRVFFRVASFAPGSGDEIVVNGDLMATAALGPAQRGVHMSRLVESVQDVSDVAWPDLDSLIRALVLDVARRQSLDAAKVSFDGIAQIADRAPVSGRRSLDSWGLHAEASVAAGYVASKLGLTATIMTACPCTRMYSWYSAVLDLADQVGIELANQIGPKLLTFTHSQRATVQVSIDGGPFGMPLSVCYEAICASAHVVHELLKRPDEHHLVRQAHERPQFTEDVVRESCRGCCATGRSGHARRQPGKRDLICAGKHPRAYRPLACGSDSSRAPGVYLGRRACRELTARRSDA